MATRYEVRLSGSGGQGLILAGVILAEAAAIYDGKNAVQSQSYGPEARGGASKAEVIISDGDIDYPKATSLDLLLCLTQASMDKYHRDMKAGAIVIVDCDAVKDIPNLSGVKIYSAPLVATATAKVGKAFVANIVSLGFIVGVTDIVSRDSITQAVLGRVPRGTEMLNQKALDSGFDLVPQH